MTFPVNGALDSKVTDVDVIAVINIFTFAVSFYNSLTDIAVIEGMFVISIS